MACHIVIIVTVLGFVVAQDYFEEKHKYQLGTEFERLQEIPTNFEVKGENALSLFKKYVTNIQDLATKKNRTITYKVKVDVENNKHKSKRGKHKKSMSKKFNVPLKKKNMKRSSFEIELRKHVSDNHIKQMSENIIATTEKQMIKHTTKQTGHKYRPIIHGVKTRYSKVIKPVRNKVIMLTN